MENGKAMYMLTRRIKKYKGIINNSFCRFDPVDTVSFDELEITIGKEKPVKIKGDGEIVCGIAKRNLITGSYCVQLEGSKLPYDLVSYYKMNWRNNYGIRTSFIFTIPIHNRRIKLDFILQSLVFSQVPVTTQVGAVWFVGDDEPIESPTIEQLSSMTMDIF